MQDISDTGCDPIFHLFPLRLHDKIACAIWKGRGRDALDLEEHSPRSVDPSGGADPAAADADPDGLGRRGRDTGISPGRGRRGRYGSDPGGGGPHRGAESGGLSGGSGTGGDPGGF